MEDLPGFYRLGKFFKILLFMLNGIEYPGYYYDFRISSIQLILSGFKDMFSIIGSF